MSNPLVRKFILLGASSALAVTSAFLVIPWEGRENQAYQDIIGVWTICEGMTKGVKKGDYKTDEQCDQLLVKDLQQYNTSMKKYVRVELKPYEEVAYTSFVWNLGETNFKNSTLLKKLNSGDREGACHELTKWNRAGGREVKGLTNRRLHEQKVCLGKDEKVNEALKLLEASKTASDALKQVSEGVGSQEPIKSVIEPLKPSNPIKQDSPEQVCSIRFVGLCFNKPQ